MTDPRAKPPIAAYVAATGRADQAVERAWPWLVTHARAHRGRVTIICAQKSSLMAMELRFGRHVTRGLMAGRTYSIDDTVSMRALVLSRGVVDDLTGDAVLALWVNDKQLALIEAARPAAIAFIPWTTDDGTGWIAARAALQLRWRR